MTQLPASPTGPTRERDVTPVRLLSAALTILSTLCVVAVVGLVVLDVAARNLAGASVPGVLEVTEVTLVAIVYLGLAMAQRRQEHVSLSMVVDRLGGRWQRGAHFIAILVCLGVTLWFACAAWDAALTAFARGEYRFGLVAVPIWPARFAIAIGLTVLILELLVDLKRILNGAPLPSSDFTEGVA
ncbi:TRAP transporter small permease [Acuticoccus sp. I52.16.1]|uniref:TRAP transporter small permease n=1 Tax=Acuticoccus sp. I52.16.1 TaxID=2928472 RepID=UPI001FD28CB8|nr:TRAP transporter small permease [Acuticoccus sp. I52.16.1]UOM36577.1 TRAP transporter small permease [Acuticoccus sp. I52.16.1]